MSKGTNDALKDMLNYLKTARQLEEQDTQISKLDENTETSVKVGYEGSQESSSANPPSSRKGTPADRASEKIRREEGYASLVKGLQDEQKKLEGGDSGSGKNTSS
jgi:hypothetical protein